jgi:hypothetical protein
LYRFGWARLSPWLPVTLALEDLEGLRGKAYQQRCGQVTRRGAGVVMWIYAIADMAACWFGLAFVLLVKMFIPDGQDGPWRMAIESYDPGDPMSLPLLILRTVVGCVMLAMSLADVFLTGAGFGVYLNNRTWIEGWDVELAFKRLARRLSKTVMLGVVVWAIWQPVVWGAVAVHDPAQVIREVKADAAFKVHTVIDKVPNPSRYSFSWDWLQLGNAAEWVGRMFTVAAVALMASAILWLLWICRQVIMNRGRGAALSPASPAARIVMGLEVSPETLPADIPGAARSLWRQGRHQDALGLLYRGAISRVMEEGRVEIQESDTEGDCMRRVAQVGAAAHPDYFRGITGIWIRLAYAGHCPAEREVEALCQQWPFVDRRDG